ARDLVEPGLYSMPEVLGPSVVSFARPELSARVLPPLLRGDDVWCQGFSEPGTGSNLASLTCRAVRVTGAGDSGPGRRVARGGGRGGRLGGGRAGDRGGGGGRRLAGYWGGGGGRRLAGYWGGGGGRRLAGYWAKGVDQPVPVRPAVCPADPDRLGRIGPQGHH